MEIFPIEQKFYTFLMHFPGLNRAFEDEVFTLIESKKLFGVGLGLIDVHLIASALIHKVKIWTKDKSLLKVATALNINK